MTVYNNSYTNTFSGFQQQVSDISEVSYVLNANIKLFWPNTAGPTDNVTANFIYIEPLLPNLDISIPDATQVTTGQKIEFYNAGSYTYSILDFAGGELVEASTQFTNPGQSIEITLIDNSTQAGTWVVVIKGQGNSIAQASALAGNGLEAENNRLTLYEFPKLINSNYNIQKTDRAYQLIHTGGTANYYLPTPTSVGIGWNVYVVNTTTNGGQVLVIPNGSGVTINGLENFRLYPAQSAMFFTDGNQKWFVFGYGTETYFSWTINDQPVGGNVDVTLDNARANKSIQIFTGVLTGDINVIFPAVTNVYIMSNRTTGSFTLNVKTASGTPYELQQNETYAFYCDSSDFYPFPTTLNVGDIVFPLGSAADPSIVWSDTPDDGFYKPALREIGISFDATQQYLISETQFLSPDGTSANPSQSFLGDNTTGGYRDEDGNISFSVGGAQILSITPTQARMNNGTAGAPAWSFRNAPSVGPYLDTSMNYSIAVGGNQVLTVTNNQSATIAGTASIPGWTFRGSLSSGAYMGATGPTITYNGSSVALFTNTGICNYINGSASSPAWFFYNAQTTGMYLDTGNSISFTVGGTKALNVTANNVTFSGTVGNLNVSPTTSTGIILNRYGVGSPSSMVFADGTGINGIALVSPTTLAASKAYQIPGTLPTTNPSTLICNASGPTGIMSWSPVNNVQVAVRTSTSNIISSNTEVTIPFDTNTVNNGGFFNTSLHYFQPLIAGVYEISVTTQFGSTPNLATQIALQIYQNATPILETAVAPQGFNSLTGTVLVTLSTSDQVKATIDNANTTNITQQISYFNAHLVSR